MASVLAQELTFSNETLDVDGFLCDLAMHVRRKDLRPLLSYIGMPGRDIDDLLLNTLGAQIGTERGLLTSSGVVVDGSSHVNFLEQRKKIMHAWWHYAAQTNQRSTPAQQKVKVIDPRPPNLPLPKIKEEGESFMISQLSPRYEAAPNDPQSFDDAIIDNVKIANSPPQSAAKKPQEGNVLAPVMQYHRHTDYVFKAEILPPVSDIPIVQMPSVETNDSASQTAVPENLPYVMYASDKSDKNTSQSNEVTPNDVTIDGTGVTLEENLKKLWRCLQACGLKRIVDEIQQRWMIRLDTNEGKADMFPKMTWGTPPPPQTPFTYPPFKKIGHMSVMGSPMFLETKPKYLENMESDSLPSAINTPRGVTREATSHFLSKSLKTPRSRQRSVGDSSGSSSLDAAATSFPARESWKLRTDTVKRQGGTLAIHIMVDNVTFPAHLTTTWGSSLNVTSFQMREKAARVFLGYVVREGRALCKCVDRMERIRGLVVEKVLKRITGGLLTTPTPSIDSIGSELIVICRCLYPETVEQLWLWYQSGQLRESVQAGLVTKRACQVCAVDQLRVTVSVTEEEYRRALGLLRRKPMPNTKTGRFYVTSGTGGITGGKSGLVRAQRQAMMSVTKYIKLPVPSPSKQLPDQPFSTPLPVPSTAPLYTSSDVIMHQRILMGGKRVKNSKGLMEKILSKEVLAIRQRVRMCEDEWCEFASRDLNIMIRCARHVMQRRIQGAVTKDQLTPTCKSLSLLRALHHALMARMSTASTIVTPRGSNTTNGSNNFGTIALFPAEVAFSHFDLVTTIDDDDSVIKARKQEERDFASAFAHFSDLVAELGQCRNNIQEKVINRLTTNPTVAHSKQLYLTKDIYLLMERWRNLVKRDFNFAEDIQVQNLSQKILSDKVVSSSFHRELKDQFPGIIGLLPAIFQIADQVLEKLQGLLAAPHGSSVASSMVYPSVPARDGHRQTISIRLTV